MLVENPFKSSYAVLAWFTSSLCILSMYNVESKINTVVLLTKSLTHLHSFQMNLKHWVLFNLVAKESLNTR